MSNNKEIAFTYRNPNSDWQGGHNYFRSLFMALNTTPGHNIVPVVFMGSQSNAVRASLPRNVRIVSNSVFDRKSVKWCVDKVAARLLGRSWLSNRLISGQGIDILSHAGPTGEAGIRNIAWIPDFQHVHLPQFFSKRDLRKRNANFRDTIARSDLIVLSSEAARRDLAAFAPKYVEKVRVLQFCSLRQEANWRDPIDLSAVYGIDGPFFYIPNQLWAHKNHLTAIRALAQIKSNFPELTIVCSGSLNDYRNPGHLERLREEIFRLGLDQRFKLLGVIDYSHVAHLMLQSVAVVNPSLFEGWSTTVEEAKVLGRPLILSDIKVHREQCINGEAIFFDSLDEKSLADQMITQLHKPFQTFSEADDKIAISRHSSKSTAFAKKFVGIVNELG